MKASVASVATILAICAGAGSVQAEEQPDHRHSKTEMQADKHAQHREHQVSQREAPVQEDPHAGHDMPSKQDDGHAGHQMPRMQHDQHTQQPSDQPTESERAHVPPDPPEHFTGDMPKERMVELMQMEDDAAFAMVLLDQLEWREINGDDALAWELQAWYGTDYHKLWFETEGGRVGSEEEGRVELMWDRIFTRWWSVQAGVRQDFGEGPSRTWLDFGIQGLAPYFFEVDAALYVGEQGRTAARLSVEYDMLITQRLILQPEIEVQAYGKSDPENGIGSGLSDAEVGLRLRYEIRREFAPYIGLHWERKFGRTADLSRAEGEDDSDLLFVAGVRAWF